MDHLLSSVTPILEACDCRVKGKSLWVKEKSIRIEWKTLVCGWRCSVCDTFSWRSSETGRGRLQSSLLSGKQDIIRPRRRPQSSFLRRRAKKASLTRAGVPRTANFGGENQTEDFPVSARQRRAIKSRNMRVESRRKWTFVAGLSFQRTGTSTILPPNRSIRKSTSGSKPKRSTRCNSKARRVELRRKSFNPHWVSWSASPVNIRTSKLKQRPANSRRQG